MTPNASYVCRFNLKAVDDDGVTTHVVRGHTYQAVTFTTLVSSTGERFDLPLHIARNPTWYFERVGDFNPLRPQVTQREYVNALVRGNEGLDLAELFQIALGEQFAPLGGKPMTRNILSAVLSQDTTLEMRRDGLALNGTGHGGYGCTYHAKRRAAA